MSPINVDDIYKQIYPEANNPASNKLLNPATFNSFSGANVLAVFNNRVITEVQAITYSIKREIAPVFTMGTPNPLSFSSGKRGIAGSLVLVVFDREALLSELVGEWGNDESTRVKIFGNIANFGLNVSKAFDGTESTLDLSEVNTLVPSDDGAGQYGSAISKAISNFGGVDQFNLTLNAALNNDIGNLNSLYTNTKGFGVGGMLYADQIPPFNITISIMNETGRGAQLDILGVKIMNEGQGFSVDDITNEKAYSFVAREVLPMRPRGYIANSGSTETGTS